MKIIIGSVTAAQKAKRILQNNGYRFSVTKISSGDSGGCQYGFDISERDLLSTAAILRGSGMDYRVK